MCVIRSAFGLIIITALIGGCQSAAEHAASVHQAEDATGRLTLGTVQRAVKVGMTSAEVAQILGAPNMVTTDEHRREVWVYDKIATDSVSSGSAAGGGLLIFGASSAAGARSTSQRTLTVVVKFDDNSRVRDFSYRSSTF